MAKPQLTIIHTAGRYAVREHYRTACTTCARGWESGELAHPSVSGVLCEHGSGRWTVGIEGPRGGWRQLHAYTSRKAAEYLCNALSVADMINDSVG